ncbi:hypothetical protein PYH37_003831 [Sinorhizobium numidicum]|uniref:Uncharacterized protein n=1 Tax=Sinorhizobium numidicum TaxID=680248 RepID=A0ABY8D2T3_9HYPH|nr:hypothetical protein [Sinorhizobium numidicum]WEX79158.1 hypothetical protein PYH37_003831 [Sinorhizobium numidicum]WEX85184.1 hypothetical protein PYH38_004543 [Sinorhizobium numidicum]
MLALTALNASPGLSQQAEGVENGRCRVDPGVDGDQKSYADKLDECNGVLEPPAIGDSEIVEPAPNEGKTPVIRPEELPPQQSSKP